ncbi:phytanoyl- dioxygenase family protein [Mucor ambiguus]|uniref:Phytanoyl-dioxygenase family protein n=1 Tax=Mucor ambiguus TaxID=91626 RepID=A0A0C9M762_9FUNG|nr:phytanoyl- dioxygenase family protein [Mucor ambiguus]
MLTDINNVPIDQAIKENGFVIVDNLIPEEVFLRLREACDRVVDRARKGDWKYRRLVGTQFPPWTEGTDVWGVQHMIHPDLKEKVFAEWYGSPKLLEAVEQLLHTKHDDLQLELFNLLINPQDSDFDLTWHRDAVKAEASEEEEKEKLKIPHYGTQWNTALYDDSCLFVVPNSHRRVRTEAERDITINDPKSHKMPGQLRVDLKPGQTVFYDNNILHRASYVSSQKRATLHASMGTIEGGHNRAAVILQHGLDWMNTEGFKETLPESLLKPYANLLAMAEKAGITNMQAKPIH